MFSKFALTYGVISNFVLVDEMNFAISAAETSDQLLKVSDPRPNPIFESTYLNTCPTLIFYFHLKMFLHAL